MRVQSFLIGDKGLLPPKWGLIGWLYASIPPSMKLLCLFMFCFGEVELGSWYRLINYNRCGQFAERVKHSISVVYLCTVHHQMKILMQLYFGFMHQSGFVSMLLIEFRMICLFTGVPAMSGTFMYYPPFDKFHGCVSSS
jgi:hypothetical protein